MKLSKWFKNSIDGKDGKASSRKLTIYLFTLMFIITWAANLFFNKILEEGILIIMGIFILVGHTILTAQNIVDILKRPSNSYYDNEIYNPLNRTTDDGSTDEL